MQVIREKTDFQFEGTIIDLETIGNFKRGFEDSREYSEIKPVLFGLIADGGIQIFYAEQHQELEELRLMIQKQVKKLQKPFYSFNTPFEMGVLFNTLNEIVMFERELNKEKFEPKRSAVENLRIQNYNDPFFDKGMLFPDSWKRGEFDKCIAHNRADLLKERDILEKRGFRLPDKFRFVKL